MCDKVCEVATFYPLLFRRAIDINLEKNLLWFKLQLILQAEECHCRCIIWPNAAEWSTMWWRTTLHYSNFDWGPRRPVSTVAPPIANHYNTYLFVPSVLEAWNEKMVRYWNWKHCIRQTTLDWHWKMTTLYPIERGLRPSVVSNHAALRSEHKGACPYRIVAVVGLLVLP